jgi:DNA segregation ATPase FtsK/SpoIIIE-like protein
MTEQCTHITEEDDPKLREAIALSVEYGKVSTSILQRRLAVGYGRAARLIDRMEQLGCIGPAEGNLPRRILVTKGALEEWGIAIPFYPTELTDSEVLLSAFPEKKPCPIAVADEAIDGAVSDPHEPESAWVKRCRDEIERAEASEPSEDSDGLKLLAAIGIAVTEGRISTSLLQRRLKIGYGRAAKIIDRMEALGYISAPNGNGPRRVLLKRIEDES